MGIHFARNLKPKVSNPKVESSLADYPFESGSCPNRDILAVLWKSVFWCVLFDVQCRYGFIQIYFQE